MRSRGRATSSWRVEKASWDRLTALGPADLQRGGIGRGQAPQSLPLAARPAGTGPRSRIAVSRGPPRRGPDEGRLSEPEARRQASLELGGVPQVQEAVRDTWIWRWLDALVRDVRYAMREPDQELGLRAWRRRRARAWPSAPTSPSSRWSIRCCFSRSPIPTPSASSRSRHCGPTPDAPARTCPVPTFSTGRRRTTCSRRWRCPTVETTAATIVGDRAVFANARYVSADFFAVFGQTASAGRLLTEQDVPAATRSRRSPSWRITGQ